MVLGATVEERLPRLLLEASSVGQTARFTSLDKNVDPEAPAMSDRPLRFGAVLRSSLGGECACRRRRKSRITLWQRERSNSSRLEWWHVIWLALIGESIVARPAAVSGRRHTDDSAKHGSKVTLIAKAHLLTDTGHRFFRFGKQGLRPLDAEVIEVSDEREPGNSLEKAHEMRFAHPADTSRFANLDRAVAVIAEIAKQRS
jgi:hypothetical protein